jgi:hypothetical protein
MHEGTFVFSQLMEFVPWRRFQTCVNRYGGDYKVGTYPCVEQFRVMAFAQLTYRHSLREVEACLRVVKPKFYHMGIHSTISHSNLAHANPTKPRNPIAQTSWYYSSNIRTLMSPHYESLH